MTSLVLLETERLRLCGWQMSQVDDLVRLHGDGEIARYLSADGMPWAREKCEAAIAGWISLFEAQRLGKMRLERKIDGVLVGRSGFGIFAPTGEREIGFALYREFRGLGYATEAASALRDWLFSETTWAHFIGFADLRNAPSLATLKRIGMMPTHIAEVAGMNAQFHILRKSDV